jgi:hypothetical protein
MITALGTGATGNVSVTTPSGTVSVRGFTYIPPPTITSVTSPAKIISNIPLALLTNSLYVYILNWFIHVSIDKHNPGISLRLFLLSNVTLREVNNLKCIIK